MLGIETGIRQIYTIIPWQLQHKLNYFLEMLKVSKIAFLKEQIFVEGKYRKSFDIFGRECAISQNEIFKIE
jgi:hypothetical protein